MDALLAADSSAFTALGCDDVGVAGVHEAYVGVKHSSAWSSVAQSRILSPLWADRLSKITQIGAVRTQLR